MECVECVYIRRYSFFDHVREEIWGTTIEIRSLYTNERMWTLYLVFMTALILLISRTRGRTPTTLYLVHNPTFQTGPVVVESFRGFVDNPLFD